jgi:hypothetical protein
MKKFCLFLLLAGPSFCGYAQTATGTNNSLYNGFKTPPKAAKPRVWWHWMNGNITKSGIAEVILNGKSCGIAWKKPFRIDVTNALKPGANKIEIKVTNLWVNRLIGDQQPGVTRKITYTTMPFYQANSPLLPAGLLGPVKVYQLHNDN